ncbi:MAG: MogA/MoaB family molybdenum cofactor biosynthesis protein [Phototrophicaceae bacterium]
MGATDHRALAGERSVSFAIITVSDTRTPETDGNHHYLSARLNELGHQVVFYHIVKDEPSEIERMLAIIAEHPTLQIALFNGGTGITKRDTTYDVISQHLEKTLVGFGELFRMLSFAEVGAAAMLSRATGGVYRGKVIFSMPGSTNAVQIAFEKLIVPEISHLAWELTR